MKKFIIVLFAILAFSACKNTNNDSQNELYLLMASQSHWKYQNEKTFYGTISDAFYDNGNFYFINGNRNIVLSNDAITWYSYSSDIESMMAHNNIFCCSTNYNYSCSNSCAVYSVSKDPFEDGDSNTRDYVTGISYCNNRFIVGSSASRVNWSTDGKTWDAGNISDIPTYAKVSIKSFVYGNGVYIAQAGDSGGLLYSTDLKNWTPLYNVPEGNIIFTGDRFIAIGEPNKVLFSTDGITWNSVDSPITNDVFTSIAYGDNLIYAGTKAGKLFYSADDGTTWKQDKSPFTRSIQAIVYGNGMFWAIDDASNMATYKPS
jgi:hypothetical protein